MSGPVPADSVESGRALRAAAIVFTCARVRHAHFQVLQVPLLLHFTYLRRAALPGGVMRDPLRFYL